MAKFTKTSMLSGITRTIEFAQYTQDEFEKRYLAWKRGDGLIQEIFSELSDSGREFILTGSTDAEWDNEFGDDDE
jgi:hypothetical protein